MREYTKLHEQHLCGNAGERDRASCPDPVRGEVAFAVAPVSRRGAGAARGRGDDAAIDELLDGGRRVGDVAKLLAARGFGDRRELYARAAARKAQPEKPD